MAALVRSGRRSCELLGVNRPFSRKLAAGILGILQHYNKVGEVRPDGQVKYEMYLMKVKSRSESKTRADFCSVLAEIPGDQAFRPLRKVNVRFSRANETWS